MPLSANILFEYAGRAAYGYETSNIKSYTINYGTLRSLSADMVAYATGNKQMEVHTHIHGTGLQPLKQEGTRRAKIAKY